MPSSTTTQESVDHRARALRLLDEAHSAPAEDLANAGRDAIYEAQVHSNLAIEHQLRRIGDVLEGPESSESESQFNDEDRAAIKVVLDSAQRLDPSDLLSVGLTQTMIARARGGLNVA